MRSLSSFFARQFKVAFALSLRWFEDIATDWKSLANLRGVENQQLLRQIKEAEERAKLLKDQVKSLVRQSVTQTTYPKLKCLPGHQFDPKLIAVCCQLCLITGFRAVPKVLECVSKAYNLDLAIPSHDAVRNWNCRNGVAILAETRRANDWIWLVDHSVQLGQMSVLAVLGIRAIDVPRKRALKRSDMTVLGIMPTNSRTKQEIGKQLQSVADEFGKPVATVSDGARELQEALSEVQENPKESVCLDDVKHKIAVVLKRELNNNKRWQEFERHLGTTTSAIQQTELEHLLPPRKKQKCRFMNFDHLVDWAVKINLVLLSDQATPRMLEKLGWVAGFVHDLVAWQEARAMIGRCLHQTNSQGTWEGSTEQLRQELGKLPANTLWSIKIREQLTEISQNNELKLKRLSQKGLVLPCSTEVLESAFGSFKVLQRNHSRGSFTTLLATFATLFDTCTTAKIRTRFANVTNKKLKAWIRKAGLTNSTQARRMSAPRAKSPKLFVEAV